MRRFSFFILSATVLACGSSPASNASTDAASPDPQVAEVVDSFRPTELLGTLTVGHADAMTHDTSSLYVSVVDRGSGGSGGLFRIPLAGGPAVQMVAAIKAQFSGVLVDDGFVYWSDAGVLRMPLAGGNTETVLTTSDEIRSMAPLV